MNPEDISDVHSALNNSVALSSPTGQAMLRICTETEQLLRAQLQHEREMREYCRYQREAVARADAMRPVVEAARAWLYQGGIYGGHPDLAALYDAVRALDA